MNLFRSAVLPLVLIYAQTGPARANSAPQLVNPSGEFGIGRISFDWVDRARPATCPGDAQAEARGHREMMVYLWYPSPLPRREARGAYVPLANEIDGQVSTRTIAHDEYGATWPLMLSGEVYSHALENAPVANSPHRFPLVLFSHGLGSSEFSYSALIEDLVSHGYAVAGIEHPCSTDMVAFPGGRVAVPHREAMPAGLSSDKRMQWMMAGALDGIAEGAADDRFVLDKIAELNAGGSRSFVLAGKLDLRRVAALGHSAGGAIAARACQLDRRIRACVDLEGQLIPVEAIPEFPDKARLQQPLLFIEIARSEAQMGGTHQEHEAYFGKREEQLRQAPAGSYDVVLRAAGMRHSSFSDGPILNAGSDNQVRHVAEHNLEIIETMVRTFLDDTLGHGKKPVLTLLPASDAEIHRIGNGRQ